MNLERSAFSSSQSSINNQSRYLIFLCRHDFVKCFLKNNKGNPELVYLDKFTYEALKSWIGSSGVSKLIFKIFPFWYLMLPFNMFDVNMEELTKIPELAYTLSIPICPEISTTALGLIDPLISMVPRPQNMLRMSNLPSNSNEATVDPVSFIFNGRPIPVGTT